MCFANNDDKIQTAHRKLAVTSCCFRQRLKGNQMELASTVLKDCFFISRLFWTMGMMILVTKKTFEIGIRTSTNHSHQKKFGF